MRTGDGVLERDQVAGARENELERPRRVRLRVVAMQLQRVGLRPVGARDRGEGDVVARLLEQAEMDEAVMGLRPLDVGERANAAPEAFLEPELREDDLARGLVHLEVRER